MITIDLARAGEKLDDPCDVASARRVAELLRTDARALARARALATRAAVERAGSPIADLALEVQSRANGRTGLVDVDVEGAVAAERPVTGRGDVL
jgi:hypothetical protein